MDKANAKARIEELRALIEKANHDYYDLHQPTVGDRDYDMWEQELLKLLQPLRGVYFDEET